MLLEGIDKAAGKRADDLHQPITGRRCSVPEGYRPNGHLLPLVCVA